MKPEPWTLNQIRRAFDLRAQGRTIADIATQLAGYPRTASGVKGMFGRVMARDGKFYGVNARTGAMRLIK